MSISRLRTIAPSIALILAVWGLSMAGCAGGEDAAQECAADRHCESGEICNASGKCVPGSRDAGADGSDTMADSDAAAEIDAVVVEPADAMIQVGGTIQLSASAFDVDGNEISDLSFEWSSDAESVATVSDSGQVTGVAEGTATMTASVDGVSGEATIEVGTSSVDSVELSTQDIELFVGDSIDVDATALDVDGNEIPDATFVWSIADESIATVDDEGVVLSVAEGETTLTVNSDGVEASTSVTVRPVPVDSVEITPSGDQTIQVGSSSLDLDATAFDADDNELTGRDVIWTSTNDSIASVDADGIVTGVAVGGPIDITAEISGVTASVAVTVQEGNQAPTADAGADVSVELGNTANLDGSASSDPDGDTLTYTWAIVSSPGSSSAALSATSTATTTLTPDVAGDYEVELTVDDGNGGTATDTVIVTGNGAPSAQADNAMTDEDTAVDVDVLANDSDPNGDTLRIDSVTSPSNGTAVISDQGNADPTDDVVTYTPDADYNGSDAFEYTVVDGNGGSATATVSISIQPVNDAPTADAGQNQSVTTGSTVTLDGSASDDPESTTLTYAWSLTTVPSGSSASLSDDSAVQPTFTADVDGTYIAELSVTDGDGAQDTDTVEIAASASPNSAPTFTSTPTTSVDEDAVYTYDITTDDADGDTLTITASTLGGGSLPAWLTFTDNGDGTATLTGTPTNADVGSYNIELNVDDGTVSINQTFSLTVNNTNDAPTADAGPDQTVNEGVTVNLDGSGSNDVDPNDTLSYNWVPTSRPGGSNASLMNANSVSPSITVDAPGTFIIELTVTDSAGATGTDSVSIFVNDTNQAPSATADSLTVNEDTPGVVDVLANDSDPDGDTLEITSTTTPANGSVVIEDQGTAATDDDVLTYTPDTDYNGSDSFDYTISDGNGGTDTATVSVTIDPVNDDPVAVDDSPASFDEETSADIDVLANDSDPDGDILEITSTTSAANGTVSIEDNGTPGITSDDFIRYTPDTDFTGTESFDYTIVDGNGGSATGTVTVTVDNVNDAPTADATYSPSTVSVGDTVTLDATGSTDPDPGDTLSYLWTFTSGNNPGGDSISNNTQAQATFQPSATGTYEAQVEVTDAANASDTATVSISVQAAASGSLIISEYVEGTSARKAIEIYNNTGSSVTLDNNYGVCLAQNDDPNCDQDIPLTGTLADGDVYVLCNSNIPASSFDQSNCDYSGSEFVHNGDDRYWIYEDADGSGSHTGSDPVVDALGELSVNPPSDPWADVVLDRCNFTPYDGSGTPAFDKADYYTERAAQGSASDFSGFGTAPTEGCAPAFTSSPDTSVVEGDAYLYNVTTSDSDGDNVTISAQLQGGGALPGWLSLTNVDASAGTADLEGTPAAGDVGTYDIELIANDGTTTTSQLFTLEVTSSSGNNAPTVQDETVISTEGVDAIAYVLINDSDADGDTLSVTSATPNGGGTATVNNDNIEFTPPTGTGNFTVDYEVSDGTTSTTGTVTFDVRAAVSAPSAADDVVITEIMQNPSTLSDSDGEWFELYNPGGSAVELESCTITDAGTNSFTVDFSVRIPAGEFVTFGTSRLVGFTPNYVWPSTTLANGADELILTCGATEIDRVEWDDGATFPDPAGASMTLDPTDYTVDNNDGTNWCEGSSSYNGDLGTPGAGNDSC